MFNAISPRLYEYRRVFINKMMISSRILFER